MKQTKITILEQYDNMFPFLLQYVRQNIICNKDRLVPIKLNDLYLLIKGLTNVTYNHSKSYHLFNINSKISNNPCKL